MLDKFIGDLRAIWAAEADNQHRMEKAKPLLEQLVKDPALKAHSADWPSTEGRKNLLLYVDPDHLFVINAVVRMPGRTGSVHDHADAWVLYGVLDGSESLERFERIDDGSRPGYAEVRLSSVTTGTQGKVDLVPPHAIHAEQGGPTRSVAIIVRSQQLGEGTVLQRRYDPEAKTVVEQYGPDANSLRRGRLTAPTMRATGTRTLKLLAAFATGLAASLGAAPAQPDFKSVNIVVGSSAGGGYDTYARVLARHIGRHLPGQPSIIVAEHAGSVEPQGRPISRHWRARRTAASSPLSIRACSTSRCSTPTRSGSSSPTSPGSAASPAICAPATPGARPASRPSTT